MERLGDAIAELSAHVDAATAHLLDLIREFDAREGWNTGFCSCAAWLSWRVGLDLGAARERVRVARALGTLPLLARALARGELSYATVRALTRVATPETEGRLLAVGRAGTAAQVERIVRGWRRVDLQAEAREAARQHASRALHVHQDEDGMVVLRSGDGWRPKWARSSCRRSPRRTRRCISGHAAHGRSISRMTRRGTLRPWPSSRRTRWPCSLRPPSTTASTPAHRASAIRWWSTSMLRSWRPPTSPDNLSSRTAYTFPRKRPAAWRVTRAGW